MKIRYLGHAAFDVTLKDGRRIVFDPYEPGSYDGAVAFDPIEGTYDIAVVSHDHADHRWDKLVNGIADVADKAGDHEFNGIRVTSYPTFHDETSGSERGVNLISVVDAEGIKIAHLGDLGHMISIEEMPVLHNADVILIPIGGFFTIDAETAAEIAEIIKAKIIIPMHFKHAKLGFPIGEVSGFTDLMENVEMTGKSELEIDQSSLPAERKVIVLEPAL